MLFSVIKHFLTESLWVFRLLVKQNKQFEDVALSFVRLCDGCFENCLLYLRPNDKVEKVKTD